MSSRYQAGIVLPGYNALKVANAPTIGTATMASATSVSVAFTAPACTGGGAISSYRAYCTTTGTNIATGASSPLVVTGLTTGTAYTFRVSATNVFGPSYPSAASNSATPAVLYMTASSSGATETTAGNYKIAVFNGSGSFTVSSLGSDPTEGASVEYLVVAGGGGGGQTFGGGGGAGGMRTASGQAVTAQTYTITRGGGGTGGTSASQGTDGNTSSFGSLISTVGGGGGGGNGTAQQSGRNGGSGGGGNLGCGTGGTGTSGQGSNGANGNGACRGGGGGGKGASGSSNGTGGNGLASSITGSSVTYAGGGGGAGFGGSGSAGGTGGGGAGGNPTVDGTANLGGGGGGASTTNAAGAGGSGVVVIKWRFQ
jgi:hypothetical protein